MKLKTSILVWVMVAGVLPVALFGFGVTAYSEQRYHTEVAEQIRTNLNNLASEIERRIFYDRQVVLALANSQAMDEYKPVLSAVNAGTRHEGHSVRSDRVARFLTSFQTVVPGFRTIRILDTSNNTLIRVTRGNAEVGVDRGALTAPILVEEKTGAAFLKRLHALPRNEINYLTIPQSRWDSEDLRGPPMLNAVVPMTIGDQLIGFLAVSFSGDQIDQILETAPRVFRGKMLIAELNPDEKDRDGLMLYDDLQVLKFAKVENTPARLQRDKSEPLWNAVRQSPHGDVITPGSRYRTFYSEYFPYSSRLVSWVVAARIDLNEVRSPFNRIRIGLLLTTAIAAIVSLLLARLGARRVAKPVADIANTLKRFADGERDIRVIASGADEIKQLESSFNYLVEHLQRAQNMMLQSAKLASIGQMAAGIGHEINNPLNNIQSLTKLVQRALPKENVQAHQDLESLREESERASQIIKAILNFARQFPPQFADFEARAWIVETLRLVNQAAKTCGVELQTLVESDQLIRGDRHQLQQVLVNLLLNAIQASPSGSEVKVSMGRDLDTLVIKVCDSGGGVDPKVLDKIFDPFFSTKPEGEGTGLGLSISLGIIERHGGQLMIHNNPDQGVTATILLPAIPGA